MKKFLTIILASFMLFCLATVNVCGDEVDPHEKTITVTPFSQDTDSNTGIKVSFSTGGKTDDIAEFNSINNTWKLDPGQRNDNSYGEIKFEFPKDSDGNYYVKQNGVNCKIVSISGIEFEVGDKGANVTVRDGEGKTESVNFEEKGSHVFGQDIPGVYTIRNISFGNGTLIVRNSGTSSSTSKVVITSMDIMIIVPHNLGDNLASNPTCVESGLDDHYKCSLCNKYFSDAAAKNEITDYDTWSSVGGDGYIAPTGTHNLSYSVDKNVVTETCSMCDHSETATLGSSNPITYDGDAHKIGTISYSDGWLGEKPTKDEISYKLNDIDTDAKDVGTIELSIVINNKKAINYLKIEPKDVTVTADNKTREFGTNNPALTATTNGTINSDTVIYTTNTEALIDSEVGEYDIVVVGDETQGNYKVSYVNATLTISQYKVKDISTTIQKQPSTKVAKDAIVKLGTLPVPKSSYFYRYVGEEDWIEVNDTKIEKLGEGKIEIKIDDKLENTKDNIIPKIITLVIKHKDKEETPIKHTTHHYLAPKTGIR